MEMYADLLFKCRRCGAEYLKPNVVLPMCEGFPAAQEFLKSNEVYDFHRCQSKSGGLADMIGYTITAPVSYNLSIEQGGF